MHVAVILDLYSLTVFAIKLFLFWDQFDTQHLRHHMNISTEGFCD